MRFHIATPNVRPNESSYVRLHHGAASSKAGFNENVPSPFVKGKPEQSVSNDVPKPPAELARAVETLDLHALGIIAARTPALLELRDANGDTPLLKLVKRFSPEERPLQLVCISLIANARTLAQRDKIGGSALDYAVASGNVELAAKLIWLNAHVPPATWRRAVGPNNGAMLAALERGVNNPRTGHVVVPNLPTTEQLREEMTSAKLAHRMPNVGDQVASAS